MKRKITIIELIVIICVVVIVLKLWGYNKPSSSTTPYIFIKEWGGKGSGDGQFQFPEGITVDGKGYVYVSDRDNYFIQKFDLDGNFMTRWGAKGEDRTYSDVPEDQISQFGDITVDQEGYIYVVDSSNCCIQKFDSNGNYLLKWSCGHCQGIDIDQEGYVYVCDDYAIDKFDSDGDFLSKWKVRHHELNLVYHQFLRDISVDSEGYVYIIYSVRDFPDSYLYKYTPSGKFITQWGAYGNKDEDFSGANGLAIDSDDRIFVAETGKNRIQVFDTDGNFIMEWGSSGFCSGYFREPVDVAVDSDGNVYVLERGNNRVQKFKPNPAYKKTINEKEEK